MTNWFAVHVDRDFMSMEYGEGVRLYYGANDCVVIHKKSYNPDTKSLTVKDDNGKEYILDNPPNNEDFDLYLYKIWELWDEKYGPYQGDERLDYEPWAYNSIESLASEFGFIEHQVKMFYAKDF